MTAAEWLEILMVDAQQLNLDAVFPESLDDQEDLLLIDEWLLDQKFSVQDLQERALKVVSEVSGRPWWVAMRMIHMASMKWSVLGSALILKQIDPERLSLSAWLDALWSTMFQNLPTEKWTQVSSLIEMPPPSEMPKDPFEAMEMSRDQFTSLMVG